MIRSRTIGIATAQWVLVSDLDGSLLDHHNYSFAPAVPLLEQLASANIDVVLCTSKTRAEVEVLRQALNNHSPFIVENGAAVYVPKQTFVTAPEGAVSAGNYWCRRFCPERATWLALVEEMKQHFDMEFTHFAEMTAEQVAAATGLSVEESVLAQQREFGEPLLWRATDDQLAQASAWLRSQGATVLSGGRFVHVCGDANKGKALRWLVEQYGVLSPAVDYTSMALGDSDNDIAMLEAADYAVVIRSPVKPPPIINREQGVYVTEAYGPEGWVEGVRHWFQLTDSEGASFI